MPSSDAASQIKGILAAKLACDLSVRVKNTFIEVWDDGGDDEAAVHRTCPELSGCYEPESERSPEQPLRTASPAATPTPQDECLFRFHLLEGSHESAQATHGGASPAEPTPERSPRWADCVEEVLPPPAASSAADGAFDDPERPRPQDAFRDLLAWQPTTTLPAAAPPAEPEPLPAEEGVAAAGPEGSRAAEGCSESVCGSEVCDADLQDSQQPVPRKSRTRRQRRKATQRRWAEDEASCADALPGGPAEAAWEPAAPSYAEVALRGGGSSKQQQQQQQQQQQAAAQGQAEGGASCASFSSRPALAAPEPVAPADDAIATPECRRARTRRQGRQAEAHSRADEGESSRAGAAPPTAAKDTAHARAEGGSSRPCAAPPASKDGAPPAGAGAAREDGDRRQRRQRQQAPAPSRAEGEAGAQGQAEGESSCGGAAPRAVEATPERTDAANAISEGPTPSRRRQRRQAAAHGQAEGESPGGGGAMSRVAKAAAPEVPAPAGADAVGGSTAPPARCSKGHAEDSGVRPAQGCQVARHRSKLWCHIYLSEEMLRKGFDLNKKVIGHGGSCTKGIFDATGAKVRLRGRGSGHLEGARWLEAPVHLMLAVTVEKGAAENFRTAVRMAVEHLRDIEHRFRGFCRQRGLSGPKRCCFWVGEITAASEECLGSILEGLPRDACDDAKGGDKDQ